MATRETENNAYAKFWGDKQRTLWYVMIFLEWPIQLHFVSYLKALACDRYYYDIGQSFSGVHSPSG